MPMPTPTPPSHHAALTGLGRKVQVAGPKYRHVLRQEKGVVEAAS